MTISDRIRVKGVRELSKGHLKLNAVTFDWRRADGQWQSQQREVLDGDLGVDLASADALHVHCDVVVGVVVRLRTRGHLHAVTLRVGGLCVLAEEVADRRLLQLRITRSGEIDVLLRELLTG